MGIQVELVQGGQMTRWACRAWGPGGKPRHGPRCRRALCLAGRKQKAFTEQELGEGDVQRAGSALLAAQVSGYLA